MYEDDRQLIGRMLAGDQRAFNAFFTALYNVLDIAAQSLLARAREAFKECWRREQPL